MSIPTFEPIRDWPKLGGPDCRQPSDVAIGPDDDVYVLTRQPGMVVVYDRDGEFLRSWGEADFGVMAHGITIHEGLVYSADSSNHAIFVDTLAGERVAVIGTVGQPSDTGVDMSIAELFTRTASIQRSGPPFNQPTKALVAPSGDIYVSDGYGNARVHRFSADRQLRSSWGHPGPLTGQFRAPHSLVITGDGRVVVCDRENDRLQIFSNDGDFLTEWTDFQRPASVVVGPDGLFYVSELAWPIEHGSWAHGRIQQASDARISVLDDAGNLLARWAQIGSQDAVAFRSPHGLAVDSSGDLYVCDTDAGTSSAGGIVYKFRRV